MTSIIGHMNLIGQHLEKEGGNPSLKESVKFLEDMMENDLVDIWRIRNPDNKRFTWRQKNPIIQRR